MEVRFENVGKAYGKTHAVRELDLTIKSGALHFLLGPSGCGKTTTLRMLAGLEPVSSGRILFDGRDVTHLPAAERGIGMVFQNYALWPHMTVRKNIEYGLILRKLSAEDLRKRTDEVLALTQLVPFESRFPGQLSGGQQQRVALARALAIRPNVLLLDEPLSNLDAKLRHEMRDNLRRIHAQSGITTVYVTHDQKEALSMGTSVSIMRAGRLIQSDTPRRLYHIPATPFIAGFVGETNLIPGTLLERSGSHCVVETSLGRLVGVARPQDKQGSAPGAPVLPETKGSPVTISIRPEAMQLALAGLPPLATDNVCRMTVEHLTYLGESEQLALLGPGDLRMRASIFNAPDHDVPDGSSVDVRIPPEHALVLPAETDMSSGT